MGWRAALYVVTGDFIDTKKPSNAGEKALSWYAYSLIGAIILLALAILAYNLIHVSIFIGHPLSALLRFVAPLAVIGGLALGLRRSLELRVMLANVILALLVSLYLGEAYLALRLEAAQKSAAVQTQLRFDPRTKLQVVRDLRAVGQAVYPITRGPNLLSEDKNRRLQPLLSAQGRPLLPLAALPATDVVACNEAGQWLVYKTDRHGFNNADAIWDGVAPRIAMIGDSFTHGTCVAREQNMESLLQQRFGLTLNLGVGGDGPLFELAALKEYAEPLRPKIVLWVFFEGNDLNEDLPSELKTPILLSYLHDTSFSQDLIHKDRAISAALSAYLDRNLVEAVGRVDEPWENLLRTASLDRLRSAVGLGPIQIGYNAGDLNAELDTFDQVMATARQRVNAWGGKLYLVYLPESDRYLSRFGVGPVRRAIHDGVSVAARHNAIPMIDVSEAFAMSPQPGKLFVYPGSHYNPAGYALAAQTIAARLTEDGGAPPTSNLAKP